MAATAAVVAVGALAAVPQLATAAPVEPAAPAASVGQITPYAGSTVSADSADSACQITLPDGTGVVVSVRDGRQTLRLADPLAAMRAKQGYTQISLGGHQLLLPDGVDRTELSRYDATALAAQHCGLSATASNGVAGTTGTKGAASGQDSEYRLGRLTINAVGQDGGPGRGTAFLTNLDDPNAAATTVDILTEAHGVGKIALPVGHYSVMLWSSNAETFVVNRDVTVGTDDVSVTLDVRTATIEARPPVTPRPTDVVSSGLTIAFSDGASTGALISRFSLSPDDVYRFNPTEPSTHGRMDVMVAFEMASPADATKPYQYHLATNAHQLTQQSFPTSVSSSTLATVTRNYAAPGAAGLSIGGTSAAPTWLAKLNAFSLTGMMYVPIGQQRTEYYSADPDLVWMSGAFATPVGDMEIDTRPRTYRAGEKVTEDFYAGALHPGVQLNPEAGRIACPACSNGTELLFNIHPWADNTPGHAVVAGIRTDSTFDLELRRNGEQIAAGESWLRATGIEVPRGKATFALTQRVHRNVDILPLSDSSETTWTFTADPGKGKKVPSNWVCLDGSTTCTTLPLLYAYYNTDANLTNTLTPGRHVLDLDVQRQEFSNGGAIGNAAVSVSYDDGATWTPVRAQGHNGSFTAPFTVPATGTNGYVGLKIAAWDSQGNRIDQTVLRAYRIG